MKPQQELINLVKGFTNNQLDEIYRFCSSGDLLGCVTAEIAKREGNPLYIDWEKERLGRHLRTGVRIRDE